MASKEPSLSLEENIPDSQIMTITLEDTINLDAKTVTDLNFASDEFSVLLTQIVQ